VGEVKGGAGEKRRIGCSLGRRSKSVILGLWRNDEEIEREKKVNFDYKSEGLKRWVEKTKKGGTTGKEEPTTRLGKVRKTHGK